MTIHEELDELHRDCLARLNRMGWACVDMAMSLELMGEKIDAANTLCRTYHSRDGSGDGSTPSNPGATAAVSNQVMHGRAQPRVVDPGRPAGAAMAGGGMWL